MPLKGIRVNNRFCKDSCGVIRFPIPQFQLHRCICFCGLIETRETNQTVKSELYKWLSCGHHLLLYYLHPKVLPNQIQRVWYSVRDTACVIQTQPACMYIIVINISRFTVYTKWTRFTVLCYSICSKAKAANILHLDLWLNCLWNLVFRVSSTEFMPQSKTI
jgi:hypothetical protein